MHNFDPHVPVPLRVMSELWDRIDYDDRSPLLTDPLVYAPVKRFGPVLINVMAGQVSGPSRIDIHLPIPRDSPVTLTGISAGFCQLAEFLNTHDITPVPEFIRGVTYERLGRLAAARYGFAIGKARPIQFKDRVKLWFYTYESRRTARKAGVTGRLGPMVALFHTRENFLRRFGNDAPRS